jgi:hypothetical protein
MELVIFLPRTTSATWKWSSFSHGRPPPHGNGHLSAKDDLRHMEMAVREIVNKFFLTKNGFFIKFSAFHKRHLHGALEFISLG